MTDQVYWASNNQRVADREFGIYRIRDGQLELMPDLKSGNFVGVYLKSTAPTNTPPTIVPQDLDFVIGEPSQ